MKRIKYMIVILFVMIILPSCSKKETTEFAEGLFVKISCTPVSSESDIKSYTLNIEVYQDGKVSIYADDFVKWYGEGEPEKTTVRIGEDAVSDIKKTILDEDILNLHNDVGYKDKMDGVRKEIIVYTIDDEHRVYGLNPSNRSFNKVYDLIYNLLREEIATYTSKIDKIQEKGIKNDIGIYITDVNDKKVFSKEDISQIYGIIEQFDGTELYRIVFELNDENKGKLNEYKNQTDNKGYVSFSLYNDNAFYSTLIITNEDDSKLYSVDCYSSEQEMEDVIKELKEGLE